MKVIDWTSASVDARRAALSRPAADSREEVFRLQGLRGSYGISSPAPICPDPGSTDPVDCQVVQAPSVPGKRLVADADGKIRLTYGELTSLIEDAVRNLK